MNDEYEMKRVKKPNIGIGLLIKKHSKGPRFNILLQWMEYCQQCFWDYQK